ncbi:MAG TPA: DUF2804 domain-containing protein [Candidatus Hydrogenedentes bacterium]|nr:DUF2804 domain-containing protein [Candidatus Hydrogenedentota bacterium]HNT86781.1 DUF2804 domain-containing protein [Candidatus Hydrogenedentota bacterium]
MAAREITSTVNLCNPDGSLNPETVGWSRRPLHQCNLRGRWLRKKRWEYWCVMGPDFLFSPTIANVDYAAFGAVYLLEYAAGRPIEKTSLRLFPRRFSMPDTVQGDLLWEGKGFRLAILDREAGRHIAFDADNVAGRPMTARIDVQRPATQDTLNVVIPWDDRTFQFTSKQNAMPATGHVVWGGTTYLFPPGDTWAVLDFGRGIWPYRTQWNWAAFSGTSGSDVVGVNMGARWTDHAETKENGICLNGRLHMLLEDVRFTYDPRDFMRPWRMRTTASDAIDLTFTPFHQRAARAQLGLLAARTSQCFGHYNGVLRVDGREIAVNAMRGWAEEVIMRW